MGKFNFDVSEKIKLIFYLRYFLLLILLLLFYCNMKLKRMLVKNKNETKNACYYVCREGDKYEYELLRILIDADDLRLRL